MLEMVLRDKLIKHLEKKKNNFLKDTLHDPTHLGYFLEYIFTEYAQSKAAYIINLDF